MSSFNWPTMLTNVLERTLGICVLLLMLTIILAMSAQIFFRFVLNTPLTYTDEIAQIALTWLTFLGAAWIYRSHGHITVDLIDFDKPKSTSIVVLKIFGECIVATILVTLLILVFDVAPMALKLRLGTLELTRFFMHFLPLGLGCAAICIFALEHILQTLTGRFSSVDFQRGDK